MVLDVVEMDAVWEEREEKSGGDVCYLVLSVLCR